VFGFWLTFLICSITPVFLLFVSWYLIGVFPGMQAGYLYIFRTGDGGWPDLWSFSSHVSLTWPSRFTGSLAQATYPEKPEIPETYAPFLTSGVRGTYPVRLSSRSFETLFKNTLNFCRVSSKYKGNAFLWPYLIGPLNR
jgi:hypothetical protein